MPQLVELLSQETVITILLRSESGLTLMSVWTPCETPLVVCSLQAFNLHIQGKKEKEPDRSPNQFFFSVIEIKTCTLALLTYLTCILSPSIPWVLSPFAQRPSPRSQFPLAFANISTALKPQALCLCRVSEIIAGLSASIRSSVGMQLKQALMR